MLKLVIMERVTIKVDSKKKDEIISFYSSIQKENEGEYILFFGQTDDLTVTVYSSKKGDSYKVFFIGYAVITIR